MAVGKGKSSKAKKAAQAPEAKKAMTGAARASITIPPARMMKLMRRDRLNQRIGRDAGIFLAGVMDYLFQEILEISGNIALEGKKQRIIPRHIKLGLASDEELCKLTCNTIINEGGVKPHIEA